MNAKQLRRRSLRADRGSILAILVLCGSAAPAPVGAQIVNLEKKRIVREGDGLFGDVEARWDWSKDTRSTAFVSARSHVEWKNGPDLWLALSRLELFTDGGESLIDAGLFHLRYNRKLGSLVRYEAFSQAQYNERVHVAGRYLLGTGPRFKLSGAEGRSAYLGSLYMFEYEEETAPGVVHRHHRQSSYLSFTLHPWKDLGIVSTTYWQPRWGHLSDQRVLSETSAEFEFARGIKWTTEFSLSHDTEPPPDVPHALYRASNGIKLELSRLKRPIEAPAAETSAEPPLTPSAPVPPKPAPFEPRTEFLSMTVDTLETFSVEAGTTRLLRRTIRTITPSTHPLWDAIGIVAVEVDAQGDTVVSSTTVRASDLALLRQFLRSASDSAEVALEPDSIPLYADDWRAPWLLGTAAVLDSSRIAIRQAGAEAPAPRVSVWRAAGWETLLWQDRPGRFLRLELEGAAEPLHPVVCWIEPSSHRVVAALSHGTKDGPEVWTILR